MSVLCRIGRVSRGEVGQALPLFAVCAVVLMGAVGLSVDVGQIVGARAEMQKAADAAAFAGAQELPANANLAIYKAHEYIHKNAAWGTEHDFSVTSTNGPDDTLTVVARKRVNYTFMKVLGLQGTWVSAKAVTRRSVYVGGSGLLPWGFIASNNDHSTLLQNSCYLGNDADGLPMFRQNVACTMKFGAGTNAGGDFGALALDGVGANVYRDTIKNGSHTLFRIGDMVEVQTGNMQGPTSQGVADRLSRAAPAGCPGNSKANVLVTNANGTSTIRPGCERSPRLIVIPVVDQIHNPQDSKILGFAIMFLTGPTGNGGQTRIEGEFVTLVTALDDALYEGSKGSTASAISLKE